MKIGIDFDNTIANYDGVFYQAALNQKLIPSNLDSSKASVRNYLRTKNLEDEWTKLQGYVYGSRMDLAKAYSGIIQFLEFCKENNIETVIVSHKSKHPYLGPKYDLHNAARSWLEATPTLGKVEAFFELTLEKKLKRISLSNCDFFVDDLPELLTDSLFPEGVEKILFDPQNIHIESKCYRRFNSWHDIKKFFKSLP